MTFDTLLLPIVLSLIVLILLSYFHRHKSKQLIKTHQQEKLTLQNKIDELAKNISIHNSEKEILASEKIKLEEKNKKFFAMSETVYKEKKRVDEENVQLNAEKEKLASDKAKVDEKVKKLWSQSTAIHKEKERINQLKLEIEDKHKQIIDSVNYAKRIQEAILPNTKEITEYLPQSFILFRPRDIVSGDFYWFSHKNSISILAAVDCTGHGVPGAFMSMIGNTLLNQIVNEKGITNPAQILTILNQEINRSLKQTQQESQSRDGMDIALCTFESLPDEDSIKLEYAGANRPLYLIQNNELQEIKANKFPIGGLSYEVEKIFTNHSFTLAKNDSIYLTSDGYADQFSSNDKKLMTKKFKEILLNIHQKSPSEQLLFLDQFIQNWMLGTEQTDDILVIGVKV
ncbi:MAG TPA: SpoIIE family protein phosphatase [Bacteroidia bacterium]|nr:SpoIIE family protein phosphatase [Bacteroidia bacterium]HRH09052.1 SpoIIE family protein phosphatase [Bacteroidia bacterium]HRH61984.1 SpoIIE family protein phosphatase [Bacteroidia bacterium]